MKNALVLSSCNGLVLYHQYDPEAYSSLRVESRLYVSSPMLLQCRPLPPLCDSLRIEFGCIAFSDTKVDVGSSSQQQHFRVIICNDLYYLGMVFYIFESERWEWKEHQVDMISDDICRPRSRGHSIFHKEKTYTICDQCMAIYDVKNGVVKCVDMPYECDANVDVDILWVSEGNIYYCVSLKVALIRVWGYDYVNDKWLLKMNLARTGKSSGLKLEFVTFNDDLQILYIFMFNVVYAYRFGTWNLAEVRPIFLRNDALQKGKKENINSALWRLKTPPNDSVDVYPFVFNPVDLSVYPAGDVEQHRRWLSIINSRLRLAA